MTKEESTSTTVKKTVATIFGKLKQSAAPLMLGLVTKQLTGLSLDQLLAADEDPNGEAAADTNKTDAEKAEAAADKAIKNDIAKTVSSVTTKAAEAALKQHKTTKGAIKSFKENLAELVTIIEAEANKKLPLFIFVDELDRCRPNYAIELLETIKGRRRN